MSVRFGALVRQTHRWLSIIFTVAVVANTIVIFVGKQYIPWLGLCALLPMILLMITGLYLFVLPYATKGRPVG